jgi:hypothetical protein
VARVLLDWVRAPCLLRTVIVNLKNDPTTALRGALWSQRGGWFVLRNASVLKPNVEPMVVDGEIVIHRDHVAFFQVLP